MQTGMFRVDRLAENDFKKEGTIVMGRLYHDIMSAQHFLPPNTKVQFSLTRNNDKFVLLKSEVGTDTEEYKVKILNICLYVPVGVMSSKMTQELMVKWAHSDIQYFYERLEVKGNINLYL